jgi:hypothetical protein
MGNKVRVCVIGAGPNGVAAAKNALQFGLDVVVFEKNDRVGGNWVFNASTGHSSVFENTHTVTSKTWSEYEDFPMPDDYPDYPNHRQVQAYFESYARHFSVLPHILFKHTVTKVARDDGGNWVVEYLDPVGASHVSVFDQLMVANGHHWNPKYPDYPGHFTGTFMHSHDFKGITDEWRGKNVLVIGAGNSGCEIAVEAARLAAKVCLSMRSPQWFVPKFLFGVPADVFAARSNWLPSRVKQFSLTTLLKWLQGPYSRYGLPTNTHPALSHTPTVTSDFLDFIRHGRVLPRPAIKRFAGHTVEFVSGDIEAFDIVCACTGFWITFPFFDSSFVDFQHAEHVPLFRRMMHPDYKNLYFIGLLQPLGSVWPLADCQAKLACAEITGRYRRPDDLRAAIQDEIDHPHFAFTGGIRHSTVVDFHKFRRDLAGELRKAGIDIGESPPKRKDPYKRAAAGP